MAALSTKWFCIMQGVDVSPDLDRGLGIFRRVSFYELMEIMTFSRLPFEPAARRRGAGVVDLSWRFLDGAGRVRAAPRKRGEPWICLVSTVDSLAASLFTQADMAVRMEAAGRAASASGDAAAALQAGPGALAVVLSAAGEGGEGGEAQRRGNGVRLLVDLGTLLSGVLVSPAAPASFVGLVGEIVQRNTGAWVSCGPLRKADAGAREPAFMPARPPARGRRPAVGRTPIAGP
ncbi:hypothetical protein L518_0693 [Bordetella bronchiseptica MBORD675]|nr:hypothetical protein B9G73_04740 [Bordetella bronchiseptica]KDC94583.1 hypothetical protein L518_0693 [Bordetella bronchiseptica MBORD675]KDD57954.1 hypothetical protein L533_1004 [Bordetella bronchiseptica OSU553]KDD99896.1 hypothetical protein L535_0998 [Bordetella bronchiseptica SBL-F6116]CCN03962.1 hypothetical protein BN116_2170 [Bordetella bronchiseptica Bbr77]CCN20239.1 hypothetical protein BN114_4227 [Bordetella bronchiseptica MO211]